MQKIKTKLSIQSGGRMIIVNNNYLLLTTGDYREIKPKI